MPGRPSDAGEELRIDKPNVDSAIRFTRSVYTCLRAICEDLDGAYGPTGVEAKRGHEALQFTDQVLFALGVSQQEINQLYGETITPGEQRVQKLLEKHAPPDASEGRNPSEV